VLLPLVTKSDLALALDNLKSRLTIPVRQHDRRRHRRAGPPAAAALKRPRNTALLWLIIRVPSCLVKVPDWCIRLHRSGATVEMMLTLAQIGGRRPWRDRISSPRTHQTSRRTSVKIEYEGSLGEGLRRPSCVSTRRLQLRLCRRADDPSSGDRPSRLSQSAAGRAVGSGSSSLRAISAALHFERRCRFASRTPAPPPFSGINSTPPSRSAATRASPVSARPPRSPSEASSRLMVGTDRLCNSYRCCRINFDRDLLHGERNTSPKRVNSAVHSYLRRLVPSGVAMIAGALRWEGIVEARDSLISDHHPLRGVSQGS